MHCQGWFSLRPWISRPYCSKKISAREKIFVPIYQCAQLHIFGHHLYLCQSTLYRFSAIAAAATRGAVPPAGRTMPATAAILQWFDFSESYTNIFEGCAVFLESQPWYLGKIHPFAWLSIPFGEQAAFHKTISQKNAKNLHVILAWICLLRFFFFLYTL